MAPRQCAGRAVVPISFPDRSERYLDDASKSNLIKSKTTRISCMLILVTMYFLAEIIVGNLTNSLTLVANSFHMFSDTLSLLIGLATTRMSKRTSADTFVPWGSRTKYFNTFGWDRFEVVGALINSTFLLAISVSIFVEAIGNFFIPPQLITHPNVVLAIGGVGLLVNIIGLMVFGSFIRFSRQDRNHHSHNRAGEVITKSKTHTLLSGEHMNMKAVFLHVMGDAIGSIIVMVTASVVKLIPHSEGLHTSATSCDGEIVMNEWVVYLDPAMSILQVIIIVTTTIPLFKQSCLILLQTVPPHIQIDKLKEKLSIPINFWIISKINGVKKIHDFHVWELSGKKLVATVNLQCDDHVTETQFTCVACKIKEELHTEGIHSTTVQCS